MKIREKTPLRKFHDYWPERFFFLARREEEIISTKRYIDDEQQRQKEKYSGSAGEIKN